MEVNKLNELIEQFLSGQIDHLVLIQLWNNILLAKALDNQNSCGSPADLDRLYRLRDLTFHLQNFPIRINIAGDVDDDNFWNQVKGKK